MNEQQLKSDVVALLSTMAEIADEDEKDRPIDWLPAYDGVEEFFCSALYIALDSDMARFELAITLLERLKMVRRTAEKVFLLEKGLKAGRVANEELARRAKEKKDKKKSN